MRTDSRVRSESAGEEAVTAASEAARTPAAIELDPERIAAQERADRES